MKHLIIGGIAALAIGLVELRSAVRWLRRREPSLTRTRLLSGSSWQKRTSTWCVRQVAARAGLSGMCGSLQRGVIRRREGRYLEHLGFISLSGPPLALRLVR